MKFLSVIITIYNKEKYLRRCLLSFVEKTDIDMEILLVDDGSTDGSGELADNFAAKYRNVKVIHKKNGGASSARKAGVREATGRYVMFIDADDWVDGEGLDKVVESLNATEPEILTVDWILHDGETERIATGYMPENIYESGINKRYFASHMIYADSIENNGINGSINTKILKRDFVKQIIEDFPSGIVYAEDDFLAYTSLGLAKKVYVTHLPLYHYEMHYDSVSHSRIDSFLSDLEKGYHFYVGMLKDEEEFPEYKAQIELFIQRAIYFGIGKYLGFEQTLCPVWYRCDTEGLSEYASVVLYGAGKVGKNFYHDLISDRRYRIVAWVDRAYKSYRYEGLNVQDPQIIKEESFDYIMIAIADEKRAKKVMEQIKKEYGVPDKKLYWRRPISLVDEMLEERRADYVKNRNI